MNITEEKSMPISVKKSTSERYILRSTIPHWWANITITQDGFLDIQSDYGNFAYAWGSFGDDFKAFLMDCDDSYLAGKIGRDHPDEFNKDETERAIRRDIIEGRKNGRLSAEDARKAWDELDIYGIDDRETLYRDLTKTLKIVYENDPSAIPCRMETSYAVTGFLKRCWPAFIDELKKERVIRATMDILGVRNPV